MELIPERDFMKQYHVSVEQDDGWFIGRVLERPGIITQGRTLDELVFMVRDAISLMWDEAGVQLELILPGQTPISAKGKRHRPVSSVPRKTSKPAKHFRVSAP